VSGKVNTSIAPTSVTVTTGYGDLLQYEWPQFQGDSSFTRFSLGPTSEAPDILWKTNIVGMQSYPTAFNGKVFVTTQTQVIALDKDTGSILWNTTVQAPDRWPAVYKIDDTRLVTGKSCLDIETGKVLWVSNDFSPRASFFAAGLYSSEEKMFYTKVNSSIKAWDFSDPSKPPTLAWETYVPGGGSAGSGVQYGDGKVFPGSFAPHQMALDAKNGSLLWDTETKAAMIFSGSYYKGKFFRGGAHDNTFYSFNATTGDILWTFNPRTQFGYWCSGSAVAYDKVYALNKDGYLYALDVNTGHVVWKYEGPTALFFPGHPVVADGKVYATTGQNASVDPFTGERGKSEFACLDAFTGKLVWTLPIEAYPPRESVAVAYGNLYLIPGYIKESQMDSYIVLDEVLAIGTKPWPMFRHDPQHTSTGQSGPTNLTLRWNFTTRGAVTSSPSVVDGRVYVGSQDKFAYCLNARSGSLVWKFKTGDRIESSPAIVDGKVYIVSDDGNLYCLDAINGSFIWMKYVGSNIPVNFEAAQILRSSPIVVGDRVYVGSVDTNVYCLDAEKGNVTWAYKTEGAITSSPAVVESAVYITSQEPNSGVLYKLDANNGSLIWRLALPYQQKARGTDMHASPSVANGMVFASSNRLVYYGINATTGKIEWTYRSIEGGFLVGSPIYVDGKLFLIDEFFIVCVNATSGTPFWKVFLGAEFFISPTYADGKLYVVSDQRAIYVLNATDGGKLSWFWTGSNFWSSPAIYEGKLYVGNQDWNVYCLADYPVETSIIRLNLEQTEVTRGKSVTVFGQLVPGIAYAPVTVVFVKPNEGVDEIQVTTSMNGFFNFTHPLDMVGRWTVRAQWQSDKGYYSSAYSEAVPLEVVSEKSSEGGGVGVPVEYVCAIVAVAVIALIAVGAYAYTKGSKK